MRLGTSWRAGTKPPANVPAHLHSAIAAYESDTNIESAAKSYWRLTWLEGKARLQGPDNQYLYLAADGKLHAEAEKLTGSDFAFSQTDSDDDDDAWLV